jgi:NAD(P)-dependent dehydrogenase (short-subunit alcohol dehydrogenase family)|tara:strand:+ start:5006 stop:5851 length:846 start_codon:yes stop_codon:yes gene_type:complete
MKSKNSNSILIIGSNSGIGKYLSYKFSHLNEKDQIFCCSRNIKNISQIKQKNKIKNLRIFKCDVSNEKEVIKLKNKISKYTKKIDILINCAADIGSIGNIKQCKSHEWIASIKNNLFSVFFTVKIFFNMIMKSKKKSIFNFSGGGAFDNFDNFSSYAISKTAVVRFTECVASEFKSLNIFCIAPGFISTNIHKKIFSHKKLTGKKYLNFLKKNFNDKKNNLAMEKVFNCISFLLTPTGSKLRGRTISVNFDPWNDKKFINNLRKYLKTDLYKMRRINLINI